MDRLLNQFVDNAPDAIFVSDNEEIIRFWGSSGWGIFCYSATETVGQSCLKSF